MTSGEKMIFASGFIAALASSPNAVRATEHGLVAVGAALVARDKLYQATRAESCNDNDRALYDAICDVIGPHPDSLAALGCDGGVW